MIHNCAKNSIGTRVKHEAPPMGIIGTRTKLNTERKHQQVEVPPAGLVRGQPG